MGRAWQAPQNTEPASTVGWCLYAFLGVNKFMWFSLSGTHTPVFYFQVVDLFLCVFDGTLLDWGFQLGGGFDVVRWRCSKTCKCMPASTQHGKLGTVKDRKCCHHCLFVFLNEQSECPWVVFSRAVCAACRPLPPPPQYVCQFKSRLTWKWFIDLIFIISVSHVLKKTCQHIWICEGTFLPLKTPAKANKSSVMHFPLFFFWRAEFHWTPNRVENTNKVRTKAGKTLTMVNRHFSQVFLVWLIVDKLNKQYRIASNKQERQTSNLSEN